MSPSTIGGIELVRVADDEQLSELRDADDRGHRDQADVGHRGHAQAGADDRHGDRQLDREQPLACV